MYNIDNKEVKVKVKQSH